MLVAAAMTLTAAYQGFCCQSSESKYSLYCFDISVDPASPSGTLRREMNNTDQVGLQECLLRATLCLTQTVQHKQRCIINKGNQLDQQTAQLLDNPKQGKPVGPTNSSAA